MTTVRRWTGREAKMLRQALRMSVRGFAEHLGVAARTVSKWEKAGCGTTPWPDTQAILDTALAQSSEDAEARFGQLLADDALNRSAHMQQTLLVAAPAASADSQRSDLDEAHLAAALANARRYLDGAVVGHFRRLLTACMDDDGAVGPAKTLPRVLGAVAAIEFSAREVRPRVRRDLLSVGARWAEFAGWLFRDIHDPERARFWYDRATEWAQEACDTAAQGYVLLKKSQMAFDERDGLRMLTLAQAAQYGPWRLSARVRAEVTQQEARGLAMVGEPVGLIERKLDEACRLFADADVGDLDDPFGAYYNEGTLVLRAASCYVEAGKPQYAAEMYAQVLSAKLLSRRDQGYFLARSASALALAGEPDEAAKVGVQSIRLADATDSQRTRRELSRAVRTLKPWGGRPHVRELRTALSARNEHAIRDQR